MFEDTDPTTKKPGTLRVLDTLSIAELEAYVSEMEAEITRVRAAIDMKQEHARLATSFFKK